MLFNEAARHFGTQQNIMIGELGNLFLLLAATASAINAFLMRKHELKEGIEVMDSEGKVVGTSQVAAKNVSVS